MSVSCECLGLRFTVVWSFSFKIEKRHRYSPQGTSKMISVFSSFCFFFVPVKKTNSPVIYPVMLLENIKNNLKVMMFFSDYMVAKGNVRVLDHYLAECINANVLNYYISSKISLIWQLRYLGVLFTIETMNNFKLSSLKVKMSVFKNGAEVKTVILRPPNPSDKMNWFSKGNLNQSSYSDLYRWDTFSHFSIEG